MSVCIVLARYDRLIELHCKFTGKLPITLSSVTVLPLLVSRRKALRRSPEFALYHTSPISRYISCPNPEATTSPYEGSSYIRPWYITEPANSGEDVQPQGEEHNHWGGSPLPLTSPRPPEGPLFTSPRNRRTGDKDPGVQRSHSQMILARNYSSRIRVHRGPSFEPCAMGRHRRSFLSHCSSHLRSMETQTGTLHLVFSLFLEGLMPRYQVGQVPRQ